MARTPSAPPIPARRAASAAKGGVSLGVESESSPYDAWLLHVPDADAAPPRVLHEIAEVFAQYRDGRARRAAARRAAAGDLLGLVAAEAEPDLLGAALHAAGLPAGGPYRVVTATDGDALAEALGHLEGARWAAGPGGAVLYEGPADGGGADAPDGAGDAADAAGAATTRLTDRLRAVWPLLRACAEPGTDLRLGVGARTASAEGLRASLCQANFALTAADAEVAVRGVEQLDTLAELLSGVPPEVRGCSGRGRWARSGTGCSGRPWRCSSRTTARGRARRRRCTCT